MPRLNLRINQDLPEVDKKTVWDFAQQAALDAGIQWRGGESWIEYVEGRRHYICYNRDGKGCITYSSLPDRYPSKCTLQEWIDFMEEVKP